jgi:hypothetical protein
LDLPQKLNIDLVINFVFKTNDGQFFFYFLPTNQNGEDVNLNEYQNKEEVNKEIKEIVSDIKNNHEKEIQSYVYQAYLSSVKESTNNQ